MKICDTISWESPDAFIRRFDLRDENMIFDTSISDKSKV